MKSKLILSLTFLFAVSCAANLCAQKKITMGDLSKAQQDSIIFAFPAPPKAPFIIRTVPSPNRVSTTITTNRSFCSGTTNPNLPKTPSVV